MKKIGCYHAHYSNIEHVEHAFRSSDVELIHFVDPGLDRVKSQPGFTGERIRQKIKETLDWISLCGVDAILITCTFFTANLKEEDVAAYPIPVIKIDDPLFRQIAEAEAPVILVFTNPATVKGTMEQLEAFSLAKGRPAQVKHVLLEHTFPLIMEGRKNEYIEAVTAGLQRIVLGHPGTSIFAAQLSMVPAARLIMQQSGVVIGNHLDGLAAHILRHISPDS